MIKTSMNKIMEYLKTVFTNVMHISHVSVLVKGRLMFKVAINEPVVLFLVRIGTSTVNLFVHVWRLLTCSAYKTGAFVMYRLDAESAILWCIYV